MISIHAPPRGATIIQTLLVCNRIFQFTPLREGRLHVDAPFSGRHISIHAPPRGATGWTLALTSAAQIFQFTPLREGRLRVMPGGYTPGNFNSRPSARGDSGCWISRCKEPISIHAPPRGATPHGHVVPPGTKFQFTPLREGRRRRRRAGRPDRHFNSRPSARGDLRRTRFWRLAKYFNSRPSARGDPFALASAAICSYFNSRPSARGDCRRAPPTRRSPLFQFTPLREGRPHGDAVIMPIAPFQFTPLREGRPTCPAAEMMQGISIHAPPRGATIRPHQCCQICQFQFTPLREGRLRCCFQLLLIVLFQFTPLREGRRTHRDIITAGRDISIHAPPRGATPVTRLEAS